MSLPLPSNCYITQFYGLTPFALSKQGKASYKNFPGGIHPGIDFGTRGVNEIVTSTCNGKVVSAGKNGGWGIMVEIQGADGWRRMFAHLQNTLVAKGDIVTTNQKIGHVGTTGNSTGIHLHYGLRRWNWYRWEYQIPTTDFSPYSYKNTREINSKLLKEAGGVDIYAYDGKNIYRIPNWDTKVFLFGTMSFEEVGQDVLSKLPRGEDIPSMK
jgi:murein DD-endopeptidase MepM/ murein hydrolase activator NlpD